MSLINTCSTAAAALLKNTENRTSSRPTYDIFLACFALCSFLGLLKQFFVYKTCTIPMFWKNSRDREEELASTSVATDFPLNLCLPYWADVSYGAQEPNEDSPYLFSWVTVHDCDTLLLHTISIGKLRGVRRRQQCDTFRNPRKIREYLILGLGLNAQWFFLQAHFKRVPITLLCVLCMSSTNWFRECSSSALICSTHHWQIRW